MLLLPDKKKTPIWLIAKGLLKHEVINSSKKKKSIIHNWMSPSFSINISNKYLIYFDMNQR